jgi:BMFP domain-containing protein YqiC
VNKLSEKLGDGKYFQLNGQYNEFNKVVVDSLGDYIVEAMIKLGAISQVISTIDKISEFEMNDSMKNDLGDLCAKLQEKLKGVYSGKREKMDLLHKDNEGKKYDMLIDARCTFERYESKINNIEKKLHQNKNPTRGKPKNSLKPNSAQ